MTWGWRKPERKADTDPQIQNARRILQDGLKPNDPRLRRGRDEHTDHLPGAIDSDFCYEEDTPCA
jgi:hypothetical protein